MPLSSRPSVNTSKLSFYWCACLPILFLQIALMVYYSQSSFSCIHDHESPLIVEKRSFHWNADKAVTHNTINIDGDASLSVAAPVQFITINTSKSKLFHPYHTIPLTQEAIYWLQRLKPDTKCKYKGRVFNLGSFKTGTKSIATALGHLGYHCSGDWSNSCKFHKLYSYFENSGDHDHWYLTAADHISPLFSYNSSALMTYLQSITAFGFNFGDGPWLYLYPLFDIWYPNSKYILTIRSDTWAIVNSELKMYCRNLKLRDLTIRQHIKCNDTRSYTTEEIYAEFPNYRIRYGIDLLEYAMLLARRYELHNTNVIKYFESRGRSNDLLVIDIMNNDDPWKSIMDYLGCPSDIKPMNEFPHYNPASEQQTQHFIPKNFPLNWQDFKYTLEF